MNDLHVSGEKIAHDFVSDFIPQGNRAEKQNSEKPQEELFPPGTFHG